MNPSEKIDILIAGLTDWRGPTLARIRQMFHEVDPEVVEDLFFTLYRSMISK